jgi:predicted alpha/beta hydrolase family esterase
MNPRTAGPFDIFTFANGATAPWYLIPFDKEGSPTGPQTVQHFIDAARMGNFTDIHVFSHGWNNVFNDAVSLYREFWTGYFGIRDQLGLNDASAYRPLIAGIIWPSTALVSEDEKTPAMAGSDYAEIEELASDLSVGQAARLREIASYRRDLTREEALELARILLPVYNRPDPDAFASAGAGASPVTAEELVDLWTKTQTRTRGRFADLGGGAAPLPDGSDGPVGVPTAAGLSDYLDPVKIIRTATVYQMKDRAGTVGANGVSRLLRELLSAASAPVHLLGHSYGCRVMLSAICAQELSRKVRSLLLLQPAVNYLCFAPDANGQGRPGGYRPALDRVERPIFTTFSRNDFPLTRTFHLALRRDRDLGEAIIAAPDLAPSRFAALGGFGPGGLTSGELAVVPIAEQPAKYATASGQKIFALDGSDNKINGHGDVRNRFTEWAHLNLVSPDAV